MVKAHSEQHSQNGFCPRAKWLLAAGLVASITGLTTPAIAQDAGTATEPATERASNNQIEEVLVVGRKREESQQEASVAVTTFSGLELERAFAQDFTSFAGKAPNVWISFNGVQPVSAVADIRGLGTSTPDDYIDPAVGIVIDGVSIGRASIALMDIFDVEAIEILRGPQGTLQGRNTTGGVILVRNNKPDLSEFGGEAKVLAGSRDRLDITGIINVPLVEDVAGIRVAVKSTQFDGYFTNRFDDSRVGAQERTNLRASFGYENDDLELLFRGEWVRVRDDASVFLPFSRCGADPRIPANQNSPLNDLFVNITARSLGGATALDSCGGKLTKDSYKLNQDRPFGETFDLDIWGITSELNYTLGETGTLTYVGNYRDTTQQNVNDPDGGPLNLFASRRRTPHWQTSHEVRFASDFSDTVDFIAGAYYMAQEYTRNDHQFLGFVGVQQFLRDNQKNSQWAIFTEANWHITEQLTLVAGARYTDEEKKGFLCPPRTVRCEARVQGAVGQRESIGDSWSDVSPRLGVDYAISENAFVYAQWAKGFRSGGFNGNASSAAAAGPYDEEILNTYEIGFKLDLLEQRLRINGAIFRTDAEDLQRSVARQGPTGSVEVITTNAASATFEGVELEVTALLADGLTLFISAGYLDSKYKKFCADLNGAAANHPSLVPCAAPIGAAQPVDLSGLPLSRAPEWNFRANLVYDFEMGDAGTLSSSVEWIYQDEVSRTEGGFPTGTTLGFTNFDGSVIPAIREEIEIFNASVTWRDREDRYSVAFFGKNLTDEIYLDSLAVIGGLWNFASIGNPRHYGLEATLRF